jgi:putative transcriptional regulator
MVRLCVLDILAQRGLSKYWLYSRMGLSYQNFNKLVNNETQSIRFENIEKLCTILECSPNDIFTIIPNQNQN